ncbi:MAG: hypothetical protein LBB23_03625 [Rickettsiales bacterium]|jgi:hypothetical protein|nr:hypothetical protein [Rickettsiales bacterium]
MILSIQSHYLIPSFQHHEPGIYFLTSCYRNNENEKNAQHIIDEKVYVYLVDAEKGAEEKSMFASILRAREAYEEEYAKNPDDRSAITGANSCEILEQMYNNSLCRKEVPGDLRAMISGDLWKLPGVPDGGSISTNFDKALYLSGISNTRG